jgi:cell division protein FtsL
MTALRLDGATGRLGRMATVLLLLTAIGVFHVWSRTRVVAVGYALGELQRDHVTLTAEHDRLRIEVETLRSPAVLEKIARTRLGMAPPAPGAVSAAGPRFALAGEGGRGKDGIKTPSGPAEPVVQGRRAPFDSGARGAPTLRVSGKSEGTPADSGAVALRGPLRSGRAAPAGAGR